MGSEMCIRDRSILVKQIIHLYKIHTFVILINSTMPYDTKGRIKKLIKENSTTGYTFVFHCRSKTKVIEKPHHRATFPPGATQISRRKQPNTADRDMHAFVRTTLLHQEGLQPSGFASPKRELFEPALGYKVTRPPKRLLASIPRRRDRNKGFRRNVHSLEVTAGGPVVPRQDAGDPFGLLLRQRVVFLGNQVDDFTADAVISQLLLLDAQDPKKARNDFVFFQYYVVPPRDPLNSLCYAGYQAIH